MILDGGDGGGSLQPIRSYVTPWRSDLLQAFSRTERELLLVCPFIKSTIVRGVREILPANVAVRTISRFCEREFRQGVSDLEAHYWLSGHDGAANFELRRLDSVHAKVFVIDRRIAFVGSSNLTLSGLLRNFESNLRIEDPEAVGAILAQMDALWEKRPRVELSAFLAMAESLRRPAPVPIDREEEEHVYAGGSGPAFSTRSEADFAPLQRALEAEAPAGVATDLAPVPIPVEAPKAPAEDSTAPGSVPSRRSPLEEAVIQVHAFQNALRARFGDMVEPGIGQLALAVRSEHLRSHSEEARSLSNLGFDREAFFGRSLEPIENAGKAAYELACFSVAVKTGLLDTYGIPAVEHFQREAERPVHLLRHWDRALLGPLPSSENGPPSKGQRTQAVRRLFGLLVKSLGFDPAMRIIEDGFNPLDAVAADIGNILSSRNPKGTLQELLSLAGGKRPSYADASSEGPDHDRVWTCRLTVGRFAVAGSGANKAEAEVDAAGRMLRLMEGDEGWRRRIDELRANFLDRARRDRPVPLRPDVRVPPGIAHEVHSSFEARMGFGVSPSQLVVALTSPEARLRLGHVDADNRTLAAIGARLIQLDAALVADREALEGLRAGPTLTAALIGWLGVAELIRPLAMEQTDRQVQEIAQALVAAVFLERGFEFLDDWLGAEIARWARSGAPEMPGHSNMEEWLSSNLGEFRPGVGYTSALQNIQQAEGKPAAVFLDSRSGPDHKPTFEVRASWDGLQGLGRASSRKEARQRAAYEILGKLRLRMRP